MAGQQDGFTDVLCLHQTVAVPPQLSDEGRYSVLMFFDTASVLLENQEHGGRGWGGRVEGQGEGPVMQPDREEGGGLEQEGEGKRRERSRRQACHDLSKAMAILLSDGDVDVEGGLTGAMGDDGSFVDSRQSENPTSGRNNRRNPPVFDDPRRLGGKKPAKGEARDKGDYGAEGEGDPEQRSSTSERPSLLALNREADAPSGNLQGELDGDLLEARLARECGIANEPRGDSFEGRPLSDPRRTHGGGGQSEEEGVSEEKLATTRGEEQHQQPVRPTSPSNAAVENYAAEYSSGDESSAAPRVDLLLSPYRASTSTRSTLPAEEQQVARESIRSPDRGSSNSDTTIDETSVTTSRIPPAMHSGVTHNGSSSKNSTAIGGKIWVEQGRHQQDTLPGTVDRVRATAACSAKYDDATPSSTSRSLRLSLDGYEDDFCDDEDESASLVQPEAEGEGSIGKSLDATPGNSSNNNNNGDNTPKEVENRSGMIYGGDDHGVAGGNDYDNDDCTANSYASSTSDGVYSGTAAGGLEADLHGGSGVGYGLDGSDGTSWGGSPEGGDEGDVWGIRSPPRPSASNHRNLSSRYGGRRKVHHGDDSPPLLVSEEKDRRGG